MLILVYKVSVCQGNKYYVTQKRNIIEVIQNTIFLAKLWNASAIKYAHLKIAK